MKKLLFLTLFISARSFGQSVTITPLTSPHYFEVKKSGIGIDQRDISNTVGLGTYIVNTEAYFQTHTNHPIRFATNNASYQMTLLTNGNFGIGSLLTPTHKLHVAGNTYISGGLSSDGMISVGSLNIGGGNTINKYFKVYLPEETIPALTTKTCLTKNYSTSGVAISDVVTVSIIGAIPINTAIANVRALTNEVEVKFCNNSNTNSGIQTVDLRFAIIK